MALENLKGKGTDVNPYIISSGDDLNSVREDPSAYYKLDRSIDLTEICNASDGTGWTPIDNFSGTFDGSGFMIKNVFINRNAINQALFSTTRGATIMNLGLVDANVTGGKENTSLLVGHMTSFDDIIMNCFTTGVVTSTTNVSGLVGQMEGGIVKNCYSSADLQCTNTSSSNAAGLVGIMAKSQSIVQKSFFNGTISGATNFSPYVFNNTAGGSFNTTACDNHYNSSKVSLPTPLVGALDDDNMRKADNFVSWGDEYYNFDKKIWSQRLNDYPHLYFEVATRYLISITKDGVDTFYTFTYENDKGVWKALTNTEVAGSFPTASEFEVHGITDNELSAISRFEWNSLREITDEFELIASTDKYVINRCIDQQEMALEQELTDAIVLSTEIDFSRYGDSINQIKIVQ